MDLNGKVCLVTGGASGIGKAFVESFLNGGAKCLFVDIQHKLGELHSATWKKEYGNDNVEFLRVDVASQSNLEQAFEKCFEIFGTLDIVVNNAGVDGEINWESQLQINLFGTIKGTQLAIKYMGKNKYGGPLSTEKGGIVLNIGSIHGIITMPSMPIYAAGKAAMVQFTRCLGHHLEYAQHGVKVICLCPYAVDSGRFDFHPYTGMTKVGSEFLHSLNYLVNILNTEDVANAGVKAMSVGKSGSIWYIHKHGDEPFEVLEQFPTFDDLLSRK